MPSYWPVTGGPPALSPDDRAKLAAEYHRDTTPLWLKEIIGRLLWGKEGKPPIERKGDSNATD